MTSIWSELPKTRMKMKPVSATVAVSMTILGPKRSAAQPLISSPIMPPAADPLDSADCHSAGIVYPISVVGAGSPNRLRNIGCP